MFLTQMNQELMAHDPQMALQLGIKLDDKNAQAGAQEQTPEELAAQEAEREKILQESMQAEVIDIVMNKL